MGGSSPLVYGLMSLTDKVANGLAVVFIQKQVPCLKLIGAVDPADTVTTIGPSCATSLPTQIPTTEHGHCFTFYKHVLFYSTGGSAVFGGIFVVISALFVIWKRKNVKKISNFK